MSAQDNPFGGSYSVQYGNDGVPAPTNGTGANGQDPAGAAAGILVKDTTTAGFAADVIQESRRQPVLVDFWAPWCGPCKQLAPALEKAVADAGGRVRLVKMNIDDHPSIAGQLGIQSIPAVIAFVDGQPVDGFMGAIPESKIREFIDKVSGPGDAGEGSPGAGRRRRPARGGATSRARRRSTPPSFPTSPTISTPSPDWRKRCSTPATRPPRAR